MDKVEILIIGTNKPIMKTIARLIDQEGKWLATIAFSLEEAIEICQAKDYKLILIGAGLKDLEELQLQKHIINMKLKIPVIKHYGGGSGLLFAEIYQQLNCTSTTKPTLVN